MKKFISIIILAAFISTSVKSPGYAQSDQQGMMPFLPVPGVMVHLSPEFTSAYIQGITTHPDNALQFDFLIHKGDQDLEGDQKTEEYKKLVKYFLASLTIPDEDQWVNLSPYEKDRIIKDDFGKTEMGRDLLAEDYLLKQITSSLIYPEDGLGKKFWDEVYERAWNEYHTTEIPVNSFNKVWIVPDQAYVFESGNSAYILKSHLKVMLEEDYLSLEKHNGAIVSHSSNNTHAIGSQVIREIILPELEKEVNEGKNFANLRQMYSGMILATWYKRVLKESLLGKVYADKAKVKGVDQDPKTNEEIYQRYLQAFKKGVFNYIKEDVDKYTNEAIPRKYFSGGFERKEGDVKFINSEDLAMMSPDEKESIDAALMLGGSKEIDVTKVDFLGTQGTGVGQKDLRSIARQLVNFFNLKYSRDKKSPYFYLSDNKEKIVTTWLIENHLPALSVEEMQTVRGLAGQLVGNTEGADLLLAALDNFPDKAMTANIVVASSDPNLRRMIKSDLETADVNVLPVASPSAMEQAIQGKVNLLVIDTRTAWVSPGIATGNIPFLALGPGFDNTNVWEKANIPIIPLPYPAKELLGKVHAILSRDAAMTAKGRNRGFQKALQTMLKLKEVKRLLKTNSPLQKEIDTTAKNENIPFITRFTEIKDKITNAIPKEQGAFYDNRTEMNYRKALVKRIELILYKQDLLIVGNNPFSTMLKLRGGFYGLEVTTAVNGIEAANILLAEPAKFKAIIFDIDDSLERKRLVNLMRLYPGLSKIPTVLTGNYDTHKDFFASLNSKNMRLVEKVDLPVFSTVADLVEDAAMTSEPKRSGEDAIINRALFYWLHNEDSPVGKMPPEFVLDFRAVLEGEISIDDVIESEVYADKRTIKRILVSGWLGAKYDLQAGQLGLYGFLSQRDGYKQWQGSRKYLIEEYLPRFTKLPAQEIVEEAENMMSDEAMNTSKPVTEIKSGEPLRGGIDFNAANLNLQIKRDGRGVPLPLAQQDIDQLMQIQGFVPVIIEIKPAFNVPIISELQQKLQPAST